MTKARGGWILALIQGGVGLGGALEEQGCWGVEIRVREQLWGLTLGSMQIEKETVGVSGFLEQFPLKLGEVQGDVEGSAWVSSRCGKGTSHPLFVSGSRRCYLHLIRTVLCVFWPPTFGLLSSPFLESPVALSPILLWGPALTTPCPSLLSTDFSWLVSHPLTSSSSVHPYFLPLAQPHHGSAIIQDKGCHWRWLSTKALLATPSL